jgi:hypothetical protein
LTASLVANGITVEIPLDTAMDAVQILVATKRTISLSDWLPKRPLDIIPAHETY